MGMQFTGLPLIVVALFTFVTIFTTSCAREDSPARRARVGLQVVPPEPAAGPAEILVSLADGQGAPVTGAIVMVEGDMEHGGMDPVRREAEEMGGGRYRVRSFEFSMDGDWVLLVKASLPEGAEVQDAFKVAVRPSERPHRPGAQ